MLETSARLLRLLALLQSPTSGQRLSRRDRRLEGARPSVAAEVLTAVAGDIRDRETLRFDWRYRTTVRVHAPAADIAVKLPRWAAVEPRRRQHLSGARRFGQPVDAGTLVGSPGRRL